MTTYGFPDITGTNIDYLQINVPFYIYQPNIKINFENSPVFENSIVVTLADGSGTILTSGVDWVINTDDIDQTAMSRAYLQDNTFSQTLVKSITISSLKSVAKTVTMQYQEFYLTNPGRTFDDGTPIEITPDIFKTLMTTVAGLAQSATTVTSPIVSNITAPSLLPFDINEEFTGNVVTNESIPINTVGGATVIRLSQGAYFSDSLSITFNGTTLNPQSDYSPYGFSYLTEKSTNKSGIYNYVLINNSFVGNLLVTYHSVGGEVQSSDLESIYTLMTAIKTYLNNGNFMSADNIVQSPAFEAINSRTNNLEDQMRKLLAGSPTYGDATAGTVVVRPISAIDANFHWWTIATLYTVAGSPSIITADRFKGRVYLPGSGVAFTFVVDVNLLATRNKISFSTESVVFDPLYEMFTSVSAAAPVYPMLRVAWNQSGTAFSGAALQFGIPLTALSDTLVVEDLSTTQSGWLLDSNGVAINGNAAVASAPNDTGFLLPDGASTWAAGGTVSFSKTYNPPYEDGYLVYQGSGVTLTSINTTNNTASMFNSVLPYYFPISNIREVIVTVVSPDTTKVYDVIIPMNFNTPGVSTGTAMFTSMNGVLVNLTAVLSQTNVGVYSISLSSANINQTVFTAVSPNLLSTIRYIRVRT